MMSRTLLNHRAFLVWLFLYFVVFSLSDPLHCASVTCFPLFPHKSSAFRSITLWLLGITTINIPCEKKLLFFIMVDLLTYIFKSKKGKDRILANIIRN